jgi:hypothetical protein
MTQNPPGDALMKVAFLGGSLFALWWLLRPTPLKVVAEEPLPEADTTPPEVIMSRNLAWAALTSEEQSTECQERLGVLRLGFDSWGSSMKTAVAQRGLDSYEADLKACAQYTRTEPS